MDISLQSPKYISPKTRYEAAKRLQRVKVAKGVCYAMQCLCVAMYKRPPQMGNVHKLYICEHYIIYEIRKNLVSQKCSSTRLFERVLHENSGVGLEYVMREYHIYKDYWEPILARLWIVLTRSD